MTVLIFIIQTVRLEIVHVIRYQNVPVSFLIHSWITVWKNNYFSAGMKLCLTKYCMKICEQNISAIIILTCFSSMQFVLCTLLSDITTNMCNAKRNINYTASKIGISKSFTEKPRKRGYKHGKLIFLVLHVYKGLWQYLR